MEVIILLLEPYISMKSPMYGCIIANLSVYYVMLFDRTYLLHQLNEWEREKATEFIDYDRLKLYVLLAGLMVWEVAGVREVTGVRGVNVCEKLDWKRALALHLCYGCGLTAPVREVVDKYNNAFQVSSP